MCNGLLIQIPVRMVVIERSIYKQHDFAKTKAFSKSLVSLRIFIVLMSPDEKEFPFTQLNQCYSVVDFLSFCVDHYALVCFMDVALIYSGSYNLDILV